MTKDEGSGGTESAKVDDADLIASYLAGEEASFLEVEEWIRREIGARYPMLRSELEDLCQAVHEKLVTNLRAGSFHGRSTLRTYVIGIARYTAVDRIRRLYRDRALFPDVDPQNASSPDNPYRALAAMEDEQRFYLALQQSPSSCKALWRMIFLERLSYEEIGRRLSIPPGTVKSRSWYCRRKLLAILERLGRARKRG